MIKEQITIVFHDTGPDRCGQRAFTVYRRSPGFWGWQKLRMNADEFKQRYPQAVEAASPPEGFER